MHDVIHALRYVPLAFVTGAWLVMPGRRKGAAEGQAVHQAEARAKAQPQPPPHPELDAAGTVLTDQDREFLGKLARIAAGLSPEHHEMGRMCADRMRRNNPGVSDTEITRTLLDVIALIIRVRARGQREGLMPPEIITALLDTFGCAALDLTAIERSTTP